MNLFHFSCSLLFASLYCFLSYLTPQSTTKEQQNPALFHFRANKNPRRRISRHRGILYVLSQAVFYPCQSVLDDLVTDILVKNFMTGIAIDLHLLILRANIRKEILRVLR